MAKYHSTKLWYENITIMEEREGKKAEREVISDTNFKVCNEEQTLSTPSSTIG